MTIKRKYAAVTIVGTTPYAQSRNHNTQFLDGETFDEYEKRTWRKKMHVRKRTDEDGNVLFYTVVIPAANLAHSLATAGRLVDPPIDTSGVRLTSDLDLNVSPDECHQDEILAHANGDRNSTVRVTRYFPTFDQWRATAELVIIDRSVNEEVLREVFEVAGELVGVGQFRPDRGGTNGCWRVERVRWGIQPVSAKATPQVAVR